MTKNLLLGAILTAGSVSAQTTPSTSSVSSADNAWMLVSCILVLMMTGPGLALFYAGQVRRKNVLATMMHSFILMALVTVIWIVFGYSLAFGEWSPYIGSAQHFFLRGVGAAPSPDYAPTVPHQTFMMFQLMFAIVTPALISGAYAERMKFSAMLLFTTLWVIVVYAPMAHMVWGKGGLLNAFSGGSIPTLDFAGGTVVHITSGVSALVCAIYLGKRVGFPARDMQPHNMVLSVIGACLLWVGWFGFNAGSAMNAGSLASSAFVATHVSASAATLSWMVGEWKLAGKPTVLGAISGAVAGLVTATPASGFVTPFAALLMGLVSGFVCYAMCTLVKHTFGHDDSLDAFGVHGACGTLGALATGVFATNAVNDTLRNAAGRPLPLGLIDGNSDQIMHQLAGCGIAWGVAIVGTLIVLKVCDMLVGLRVDEQAEQLGLDLSQHGEEAYPVELGYEKTRSAKAS